VRGGVPFFRKVKRERRRPGRFVKSVGREADFFAALFTMKL
jgi:hypothetical protein